MSKKNAFGGLNHRGLYVPMSEDEQEVIHRLVAADDIQLIIHGWGVLDKPRFTVGDHRVNVKFRMDFHRPAAPMKVHFFDLELKTRAGLSLFRERLPTIYNGQPIQVCAGMNLDMEWDIAIHSIKPDLVKAIKPGHVGMTSRRQDRDTGAMTAAGNMRLTAKQKKMLADLERFHAAVRADNTRQTIKSVVDAGYTVKVDGGKVIAPDV